MNRDALHDNQAYDGMKSAIGSLSRRIGAVIARPHHETENHIHKAYALIEEQKKKIAALEQLVTTDELTGIQNRRGFNECFQRELECCNREQSAGGLLIMIDLDNFKSLNDRFGHLAGDAALVLVAKTLEGEIRKTDYAARLGGDEFILLLTNIAPEISATRAQIVAQHLNNLSMAWYGEIIPIQASIGIRVFGKGDRAEAILHAADGTLYATKFERKNAGMAIAKEAMSRL